MKYVTSHMFKNIGKLNQKNMAIYRLSSILLASPPPPSPPPHHQPPVSVTAIQT